ncbi:MAG: hypothetical protein N2554_01750 [Fimbriimonadales bacterium]|nr:hypothetical protein [Fimbriimonadales bacterium]
MRTELPPYVVWGVIAAIVLLAGFFLYRAWTGGVQTYGESAPKPAPGVPSAPGGQMPGAPGGSGLPPVAGE